MHARYRHTEFLSTNRHEACRDSCCLLTWKLLRVREAAVSGVAAAEQSQRRDPLSSYQPRVGDLEVGEAFGVNDTVTEIESEETFDINRAKRGRFRTVDRSRRSTKTDDASLKYPRYRRYEVFWIQYYHALTLDIVHKRSASRSDRKKKKKKEKEEKEKEKKKTKEKKENL
ncbi:hypothetical protein F2P81_005259 [Scophthalmus maximus]|uniref:Uncharacterized protein n=1 Tax=Scophthalmus maximus TaxID=52904 RepID=A0A6A4T602_SCOMX|nr:hypothetical protein F2P81_005259 [Scophthalmus maximus]